MKHNIDAFLNRNKLHKHKQENSEWIMFRIEFQKLDSNETFITYSTSKVEQNHNRFTLNLFADIATSKTHRLL